ncbi:hypothetical protein PR202_ga12677 [Eleusine coracana subsp. coracana]|uniref:Uncharacterized protein n=1 Tax=Eleusine coracana subsp. coracana TaxID=191504 RepID=A0AAV5CC56_ELECO|nr:hypothetical protein QOZ80_3AG0225690 [Eleusine coracana subsp. coracana]GJM95891.1 hypothetical protein PR202_ga12677 [Eleusine coracana subsp. coracana]
MTKLIQLLRGDPQAAVLSSPRSFSSTSSASDDDGSYSSSSFPGSTTSSPSRYNYNSPLGSPWSFHHLPGLGDSTDRSSTGLNASLVKQDGGKIYSLAVSGDVLYTGTDSETVRVWRDRRALAGFRTGSGLVKAIVVLGNDDGRVFTGHQDGKVRVWRADPSADGTHRRVGSLPALGWDHLLGRGGRRRKGKGKGKGVWRLRHADAVSCLSLDDGAGLLYSGSWDRTVKVWRVADYRCLESLAAHDDAVNTVAAAGFDGLVFSGSADGTVKVWRRTATHHEDSKGDKTRHVLDRVLREGEEEEGAVTAVAVCRQARVVYVGSSDGMVACWRWASVNGGGEPVFGGVLAGHRKGMAVMCLAVSGTLVVSGSADGTLCVWRRDAAQHLKTAVLAGHTGPVKCVAVAHDDEEHHWRFVVYSGSLDGSVKVWRLSSDDHNQPSQQLLLPSPTTSPPLRRDPQPWQPVLPLPSSVQQPWAPGINHVAAA